MKQPKKAKNLRFLAFFGYFKKFHFGLFLLFSIQITAHFQI